MKITLLCIGKTASPFIKEGIEIYIKRLTHYSQFTLAELPVVKQASSATAATLKTKEGENLLRYLKPEDTVVLLDENGQQFSSEAFAAYLSKCAVQSVKHLVFVVGGAYGFSDAVYKRAGQTMALSKMTFTHDMARLIFTEQLYRAFTIINNIPYHNQ